MSEMIKLGLRGRTEVESALRVVVDELLALLVELAAAYHEAGEADRAESLESRFRNPFLCRDDRRLNFIFEDLAHSA